MALSQNVVVNFLTKFDKKGLDRATKELKGFDKTVAVSKKALKAGLFAAAVGTGFALLKLGKSSITAALAQEKLDKSLRLTLESIGAGGLLPNVKDFIDNLQRVTNVTEDQLVPALRQLIAQTGDLDSSQFLLQKSLDISAGTGADLTQVLDAITKAAVGNYKGITALGVGFTATEAKAMGFEKLLINLDKYAGAAEASTETFEGQLKSFEISAGEATETLGNGFLIASSYIVTGTDNLRTFGAVLESVAGGVGDVLIGFGKTASEKGFLTALNTTFEDLGREGFKVRQKQFLAAKGYLGLSQQTIDALELQEKFGKKKLTQDQMLAKIQAQILARQKATTKEQTAQAALSKKKAEIESMFDLDRINLQAALSRKLNAEDELRVKILQKLRDGTKEAVDEAQRYADVLKVIEDGQITTGEIDQLAKKWGVTNTEVLLYIGQLFAANEELKKMLALLSQVKVPGTTTPTQIPLATPTILEPNKYDQIKKSLEKEFVSMGIDKGAASGLAASSARLQAQADAYFRANPDIDPLTGGRRVAMADGGIVTRPTQALIGEAGAEAVIPLDRMGSMGTKVTVNVAGSVISEGQLQSVIQDVLYNLNRTGAVTQLSNLGR
jgi:hypothetical protein